jgi:hypothetical protein
MNTCLSFIRRDLNNIENLVVIRFKHKKRLHTPSDVLKAFCKAITTWVEKTEEGKSLWRYTSEDLNIGDILSFNENKSLTPFLKTEGIKSWKTIYELVDQEEVSYDKVLASPKEEL